MIMMGIKESLKESLKEISYFDAILHHKFFLNMNMLRKKSSKSKY